MPKVSIIMPTYNRGWIIERAVKSILAQTYTDFELLIIDDGSMDNTSEVLSTIKDSRIRVKTLERNMHVSVARNHGIALSSGELIAYLDTDNVWYPNYLEVMVSEFTKEYVMTYSGQNTFLVGGTKEDLQILGRAIRYARFNPTTLSKSNFIDINCVMHTKKLLQEVGMFDENLKTCEDWDLFARIAIAHPFEVKLVNQVLGEYYLYLKNTLHTLTNSYTTDDLLYSWFAMRVPTGDDKYVQEKMERLLQEKK